MSELTIHAAMAAVMGDVRAVRKGDFNTHQNYSFRGVDAVVNAVGPALRQHGVIVVPNVRSVDYEKVTTTNNKPSTACRVLVEYVFHGPAGDTISATVAAEAWDSGDKAAPKAMSVAYRTALLQALALPTDDPDPDSHSYERGQDVPAERSSVPVNDLLAAKNAVRDAWAIAHGGEWDPQAMTADYELWAGAPLADADATKLLSYVRHLAPPDAFETTAPDVQKATDKQVQVLSIALSKAGLTDHDAVLNWLEQVVRVRVESRKDLAPDEIEAAIKAAKALKPVAP